MWIGVSGYRTKLAVQWEKKRERKAKATSSSLWFLTKYAYSIN